MLAAAPLLHKPKEEGERKVSPVSIVARSPTSIARSADPARSTIVSPLSAQAKGFISSPTDASEREADRIADNVVAMPKAAARPQSGRGASNAAVARSIMRSPLIAQRAPSPANANAAPGGQAAVAAEIKAAATGGFALPKKTRAFLEPRFKADFSKVMLHNDATAKKLSSKIGARAFTYGRHIFFNEGQYNPDSKEGLQLLAHELTHTIQQSEAIQRKAEKAPRVTERTPKQASRLGISDVLDFFADAANAIPGYRMFTILIGVNPINMASVEASAANILRAIVEFLPGGNIITRVLDSYGVFDKVGGWIEGQLKSLGITGPAIKAALDQFTGDLGFSDIFDLGGVWDRAKRIFTTPITRIIDFAKGLFAKILEFVQEAVLKPLAALAAQTPFYTLLKAVLGKDPVSGEKFEGGATEVIGGFMTMIGQDELWQNIQRANAIPRAFTWFKTAMKGLMGLVTSIPTRFIDGLKGLEIMDFVVLPRAFLKIGAVLGSFLADFGSWALGTVIDLLKIIVEVVAPGVMPYIAKAAGAFNKILKDPISFVGNLIKAGKQGFNQFAGNFLTHLQASMVGWLTGAMAGANIYIPRGLSLREILKFVLSILGLTWQNIRAKLVRATNETTVVALETGFDIVRTLVTEGPAAAWQKILETLTNLQQMAIDAIKDFVKQRVVEAAVTRLLSMLSPVGAFIQAIIGMYNTFMFFKERLSQIATLVAGVIDGLDAIANGNTGPAANKVESTMAGGLTLVISFLARIAGLGRVADAVTDLIQRVRAPIDRALDAVVAWIVRQARRLGAAAVRGARGAVAAIVNWWRTRKSFRGADGSSHSLYFAGEGAGARLTVASNPEPVSQFLTRIQPNSDPTRRAKTAAQALLGGPLRQAQTTLVSGTPVTPAMSQQLAQHMDQLSTYLAVLAPLDSTLPRSAANVLAITPAIVVAPFQIGDNLRANPEGLVDLAGVRGEYQRQLAFQQSGLTGLTVARWRQNRLEFSTRRLPATTGGPRRSGRDPDSAADQQNLRNRMRDELTQRLASPANSTQLYPSLRGYELTWARQTFNNWPAFRQSGFPLVGPARPANPTAGSLVAEWMRTQHALHSPDQIAGGSRDLPNQGLTGLGSGRVNSSIGSQWPGRINVLEADVAARLRASWTGGPPAPITNIAEIGRVTMNVTLSVA